MHCRAGCLFRRAPVKPGLDGRVAAVVGKAGGSHVIGEAGEAVQLRTLVQRAAKLRQHDWESLRSATHTVTDLLLGIAVSLIGSARDKEKEGSMLFTPTTLYHPWSAIQLRQLCAKGADST